MRVESPGYPVRVCFSWEEKRSIGGYKSVGVGPLSMSDAVSGEKIIGPYSRAMYEENTRPGRRARNNIWLRAPSVQDFRGESQFPAGLERILCKFILECISWGALIATLM